MNLKLKPGHPFSSSSFVLLFDERAVERVRAKGLSSLDGGGFALVARSAGSGTQAREE